jgi:hypothetical protein
LSLLRHFFAGLPDFFLAQKNKTEKNVTQMPQKYQTAIQYTKRPKIYNGYKAYQNFISQGL